MKTLTLLYAYKTMFTFLDDYYRQTLCGDLGELLSGMELCTEGEVGTWDPAYWADWETIASSKQCLGILETYQIMLSFMEEQLKTFESEDVEKLFISMQLLPNGTSRDPEMWQRWQETFEIGVQDQEQNPQTSVERN